jgi:peptidoglycan hydrolase-like protein with peptidoglycan-binding domain
MSFDLQDLGGNGADLDGTVISNTGNSKMYYTVLHEIAHTLGIGTFWQLEILYSNGQPFLSRNWLYDANTMNPLPDDADQLTGSERPIYVGPVGSAAVREFNIIAGIAALGVPIEDDGGPGTALGHLEEGHEAISIPLADGSYIMTETGMGNEIMTGWIDSGDMPISKITVGMLDDIGWDVNYNAADPFTLDL